MKITYLPLVLEKQMECWLETTGNNAVEILTMISNSEMTFKELRQEIFNNPEWDPTEE
tara:strand:+ start:338 stop:511 length:174 start_codon:yes stop_codon:yes gene_type:complete